MRSACQDLERLAPFGSLLRLMIRCIVLFAVDKVLVSELVLRVESIRITVRKAMKRQEFTARKVRCIELHKF